MEKRNVNLCSTYVLPLLGLNQWSFGTSTSDNFINSYVSEDDQYLVVEVVNPLAPKLMNHNYYRFCLTKPSSFLYLFEIPMAFKSDIRRFREGKYSQFSESAKTMIRKNSGLRYRVPKPGGGVTSARELLALDKDSALRDALEKELSNIGSPVKIEHDAELASIPGDDNFYSLSVSTKLVTH